MRASPAPVVFSLHLCWITCLIHWLLNTWLHKKSRVEWPASLSSELRSLKGDLDRPKEKIFMCRGQLFLGPWITVQGRHWWFQCSWRQGTPFIKKCLRPRKTLFPGIRFVVMSLLFKFVLYLEETNLPFCKITSSTNRKGKANVNSSPISLQRYSNCANMYCVEEGGGQRRL